METKQKLATLPDWIRDSIAEHRSWIEAALRTGLDKSLILRVPNNFGSIAARRIMADVPLAPLKVGPTPGLRSRALSVEFPKDFPPMMEARPVRDHEAKHHDAPKTWEISWGDTPIAIRFPEMKGAVIAFDMPYTEMGSPSTYEEFVLCRQDEVPAVMRLVQESMTCSETPTLSNGRRNREIKASSWDNLILDEEIVRLVKNDYESFFQREDWFRGLNLPFRRGYLFHGKPGNGKTSVVRAMLSRTGVRGFTMNFFGTHIDDDSLQNMFDAAAERAPAIIVMEDIDRAFPKTRTTPECNVSLQQLLNCLDGVGTQDGVVVVATANDPSSLDPAILRRPGRFDRVVCFPNPSADLRLRYLQRLNSRLEAEQLSDFIRESEGMSFAQLREVYILAGQAAFDAGRELTVIDVNEATKTIKEVFTMRHEDGVVGFAADSLARATRRKKAVASTFDEVPF